MKNVLMLVTLALLVFIPSGLSTVGRPTSIPSDIAGPSCRYHPAMAFDAARRTTVLFGGTDFSGENLGDTWLWNGSHWKRVSDTGPAARAGHALAYDSWRKRVVLFGGSARTEHSARPTMLNDTWEWDGKSWSQASTSGPPPRTGHQLVYDSRRKKVVLFGGADTPNGTNLGDTWEWDGHRWTRVSSSGPEARFYHLMSYDSSRGRVVLFGGNVAAGRLSPETMKAGQRGDTWEWDGSQWKQVKSAGPSARDHHAMTFDAASRKTILFGGFDGAYLSDTWAWDGTVWTKLDSSGPPARGGKPGIAYDSTRRKVVLFGGGIGGGTSARPMALNDTWQWDGNGWKQAVPVNCEAPQAQRFNYDANAALDIVENSRELVAGTTVHDISYASPKGGRVTSYLVVPPGNGPFAAILFVHWGQGDRTEFLSEAVAMARRGVVSLLMDGPFRRADADQEANFLNPERERDEWIKGVLEMRRGIDLLIARLDVDPKRVGYVGHSYGATAGGILAGIEKRIRAYVLIGGLPALDLFDDPVFGQFVRGFNSEQKKRYADVIQVIEPARFVSNSSPASLFFQFARHDRYISEPAARRFFEAGGQPKKAKWYFCSHEFNDFESYEDRVEWMSQQLELRPDSHRKNRRDALRKSVPSEK